MSAHIGPCACMPRAGRSLLGAALRGSVCAALLCGGRARAESQRVELAYAASDAEAPDLERTLANALDLDRIAPALRRVAAVDPRALLEPEPHAPPALAYIWVDFTRPERALIYVVDRAWTRTYVRALARSPNNAALDHAQAGEIVRSAVQALQEGAQIGIARTAPARATPHPERAPPERPLPARRPQLGAGLSYALGPRAGGAELDQGPGAYSYVLAPAGSLRAGGIVALQYRLHRIESARASARLDTLALRAGPLLEIAPTHALRARISVGCGADAVHIDPQAGASVALDRARWVLFPLLTAALGISAPLSHESELLIDLVADIDLVDTRYVVRGGTAELVVENPWPVRPSLRVGVGFD